MPLPGWGGWDCSLRNCPSGDAISKRTGLGGQLEIQRVLCEKPALANYSDHFMLHVLGQSSRPIYAHYSAKQIKAAIEYPAVVGNVSVWFPHAAMDNLTMACSDLANSTHGGFLVRFDTELGDLPLMSVGTASIDISVSEYQKGTKARKRFDCRAFHYYCYCADKSGMRRIRCGFL